MNRSIEFRQLVFIDKINQMEKGKSRIEKWFHIDVPRNMHSLADHRNSIMKLLLNERFKRPHRNECKAIAINNNNNYCNKRTSCACFPHSKRVQIR